MAATRIFVSHHHSPAEDTFTARLVSDLEAAGADVWVDTSGIPSGSFVAKISEGLEGRQWLVLVMTPDALRSPWVRAEVEAALQEVHGGRMLGVIPLMLEPCDVRDIPILWRTLHRYDSTRDYVSARDGLLRALGLHLPAPAPQAGGGARPIAPASPAAASAPTATLDTSVVPPRLAALGFAGYRNGTVHYILPPLCEVPAGEFWMGSDPKKDSGAYDSEKPQRKLTLPGFQIARYLITVAEYACFVRTGQKEPNNWQAQLAKLDHPVTYVSWHDAVAYAAWLAKLTGQPWRLPTEAEWEKAARGSDGRIYPWGDSFDKTRCNTSEGGKGATTPVGTYPSGASPCGAQDMAGNIWEWTSSLYKPYPYSVTDGREAANSRAAISTELRVLRGGSWADNARFARVAYRNSYVLPGDAHSLNGFRVAPAVPSS